MDREPSPPVTMSDPVASDPVTSDPVTSDPVTSDPVANDPVTSEPVANDPVARDPLASGQFVTRDEFSRLESKFDEMLQLIRRQTEPSAPTSISSHGSGLDVSEDLDQLKARSPAIAALFDKDTKQKDKTGETDDDPQTFVKEPANSGTASVSNVTDEDTRRKSLFSQTTVEDQVKQLNQNMKQLENRLCDRLNISMQQMSEFQTEMREILTTATSSQVDLQTTVKQQTRSLEDIHDMTGHLSNQLNTVIEKTETICQCSEEVRQSSTVLIKDIQKSTETITQKVDISSENLTQQIQKSTSSVHDKIDKSTDDVTGKLNSSLHTFSGEVVDEIRKVGEIIEETKRAFESHGQKLDGITDRIQKAVKIHDGKMEKNLQDSLNQQTQNTKTHVDTKMTENTKQLKENMYQLKREIFPFTEKECQIIRDRIEGPLLSHKLYTLDFYVEDFISLIKSCVDRYSPPWHINQLKSSIQGHVWFHNNGKLRVWMNHGRHPREVGLQPRQCGKLKVKATITDTKGQLPDIEVGEMTWDVSEENIKDNFGLGCYLGQIDCQDVVNRGYIAIPDYDNDAVLVRYLVEVLE